MKKLIAFVGLFLGFMAVDSGAAGWFTSNSSGAYVHYKNPDGTIGVTTGVPFNITEVWTSTGDGTATLILIDSNPLNIGLYGVTAATGTGGYAWNTAQWPSEQIVGMYSIVNSSSTVGLYNSQGVRLGADDGLTIENGLLGLVINKGTQNIYWRITIQPANITRDRRN